MRVFKWIAFDKLNSKHKTKWVFVYIRKLIVESGITLIKTKKCRVAVIDILARETIIIEGKRVKSN